MLSGQLLTMRYRFVQIEYVPDVSNRVVDLDEGRNFWRLRVYLHWLRERLTLGAGSAHGSPVHFHAWCGVADMSASCERLHILVDFLGRERGHPRSRARAKIALPGQNA